MKLALGNSLAMPRIGGGSSSGFPMDNYAADASFFGSTRRLLTSYVTTSPVRMRDAGFNEADINFSSDQLDLDGAQSGALLGFGDGFATTIYDQSGSGAGGLFQFTAGAQPYAAIFPDYARVNGRQAFAGGLFPGGSGSRVLTCAGITPPGAGDFFLSFLFQKGSNSSTYQALGSFGSYAPAFYSRYTVPVPTIHLGAQKAFNTTLTSGSAYVVSFARESGTLKCWVNGVQEATTYADSTNITGSFNLFAESIGGGATTSDSIQEVLIFSSAKAADRAAIMANQMTHAGL